MSLNPIRIGLDEPADYRLGMLSLEHALAKLVQGGPNTVMLGQSRPILATGDKDATPAPGIPHVYQARAGGTTYFGPGVLLASPVVLAPEPQRVHEALLAAGIATCAEYGVTAIRRPLHPGLWVRDEAGWRKLASIGLAHEGLVVARGGGLALNVSPDLSVYDTFDACGIPGVVMTSLAAETGRAITVAEVADTIAGHLERLLPPVLLMPVHA